MKKCTFGISLVLLATAFCLFNLGSQVFAEEKKSPIRFSVIKAQNTEFIKNVQIVNLEMDPGAKFADAKLKWDEIVWMKKGTLDFIFSDGTVIKRKKGAIWFAGYDLGPFDIVNNSKEVAIIQGIQVYRK